MAMKCKWNCNATFCRDGKVLAQGIVLAGILLGGCYGSHDLGYEVFGMPKGLFVALNISVFGAVAVWSVEYFWPKICLAIYVLWAGFFGLFLEKPAVKLTKKSPEVRIGIEYIV